MIDFFKILIEEPEKQRKFGVFLVKIVLNIILSAKLYLYATSENVVPANINFNSIFEFVITGRFLVFCFLYFVSHFVLFGFLDMISIGTLNLIERYIINKIRFGREERKFIRKALCYFELIEIDEKEKKFLLEKIPMVFMSLLKSSPKRNSGRNNIAKNSLVKDLAHTFFIFTIIYYSCVNLKMNNNLINGLIISSAFILPMLYFIANALIDFLNKNAKSILLEIQALLLERSLYEILAELGLLNFDFTSNDPVKFDKVINFKNKNYRIEFKYSQTPVYEFELQNIKEKYINKEDKVVLISNTDLEPKAQEIADEYNQSLLIIKYNNENDLKDKISSYFKYR